MAREFAAYFDDAGHPDNQDLVLIAGFVSGKDQWLKFEDEWHNALQQCGLPRDTVFHMTDLLAGAPKSPFAGWTDHQKHRLLEKLVHIAAIRTVKHFSETVFMDDYRAVNDEFALEEFHGAPYGLAGRNLLMRLKHWLEKQGPDARLLIFFEDGTKHKGDLLDNCRRDGLPTPAFAKKRELVPLQAADLLAWEIAKHMRQIRRISVGQKIDPDYYKINPSYYLDVLIRYGWEKEDDGAYNERVLRELCRGGGELPQVPRRSELGNNYYIANETLRKKPRHRTIGR